MDLPCLLPEEVSFAAEVVPVGLATLVTTESEVSSSVDVSVSDSVVLLVVVVLFLVVVFFVVVVGFSPV